MCRQDSRDTRQALLISSCKSKLAGPYDAFPQTIFVRQGSRSLTAGSLALRLGANLSGAACSHHSRLRGWWCARHRRAPDRTVTFLAAWLIVHRREPSGRRQQYRDRGRRACSGRWAHAAAGFHGEHGQRRTLRYLKYDLLRHLAPVAGISREPLGMEVHPPFTAKSVPEFIAYAKASPGKISCASDRQRNLASYGWRVVPDDGRRRCSSLECAAGHPHRGRFPTRL